MNTDGHKWVNPAPSSAFICVHLWLLHTLFLLAVGCGRTGAVSSSARDEPSAARGPSFAVQFTDVTAAAGIRFRHTTGGFGRKLMPETMGSGCAFLDYDGDGRLDILLLNGRPLGGAPKAAADRIPTLALYRNRGDGTFRDVTRAAGLAVP